MRVKRSLALAAAAAVLFGLAWYLRNALLVKTSATHQDMSPDRVQQQSSQSAESIRRRDEVSPSAIEQGRPAGDAIDRVIASIDWGAFGGAVLAFTQAQEQARQERKKPHYDPRTIEVLARNNLQLEKIAELLGILDLRETPFHERVWPSYSRGWMKAVGVTLSAAQDAELGEAARVFSRSRVEEGKTLKDVNPLEKLAWDAERGLRWDAEVQKLLTPDQFAEYAKPAGSDPFWGRQASRQEFHLGGIEDSAVRVEAFWQAALGLDDSRRTLVKDAAMDYVQEVDRQIAGFRARYPREAPRDEVIRLRI